VAVVVLLCQAVAWVHAAATPHVTCLEHGESVHLAVGQKAASRAQELAEEAAGLTTASAASEADAHGHDHCSLQAQRTTSTAAPSLDASVATFAPLALPAITDGRPPLRLLRLAPKTSPPRAPAA
jgi:hypothetical protein